MALDESRVLLTQLERHPDNPSVHTDWDLTVLTASLQAYGQMKRVVVRRLGHDRYRVLAGHGLVAAMQQLGWEAADVVVAPDDWTDVQAEGYLLADNHRSSSDDRKLLVLWERQAAEGRNLAAAAVQDRDIAAMRAMLAGQVVPDNTTRPRAVTDAQQQQHVTLVLYMPQVDLIEAALKKTGLDNRGEALATIARFYLNPLEG